VDALREWLIVALLAAGGLALVLLRRGLEGTVDGAVKEAVDRRIQPAVLARELEKVRGSARQELRFTAYGGLWAAMRPTAIYLDSPLDRTTVRDLTRSLSDWYFSPAGGLFLTAPARDLYFTLQNLLGAVGSAPDWVAERSTEPKEVFRRLLVKHDLPRALELLDDLEPSSLAAMPPDHVLRRIAGWREDVGTLPARWPELTPEERFSVIQQVASALRTGLSADVESRLR
jgi:hypothetical protein